MFLGGFNHPPNVDAVETFLAEIWPLLRARAPSASFVVAGADLPDRLRAREGEGVTMAGHVADLATLFRCCRVSVAPLRFGAGQKGKIVTSLSHGVPVVTTSVGAESMGLVHGETAMLADDPGRFAECVHRLMVDDELWMRLSDAGLSHVSAAFDYGQVRDKLAGLLDMLGLVSPRQLARPPGRRIAA